MDKPEYCPNCGNKLGEQDYFCPECGRRLETDMAVTTAPVIDEHPQATVEMSNDNQSEDQSTQATQTDAFSDQPTPKKKKHRKGPIITIILLLVLVAGGYFAGNFYYGKERQVQALKDEATSGNTSKMKTVLVDANKKRLSDENIEDLKRLYLADGSDVKNINQQISGKQNNGMYSVVKDGKYFYIFDKYKISEKDKTLDISTNIEDPAFYLDWKQIAATRDGSQYKISHLKPGVYDLKIKGSKKSKEKQVKVTTDKKDNIAKLTVAKEKKKHKKKAKKDIETETSPNQVSHDSDEQRHDEAESKPTPTESTDSDDDSDSDSSDSNNSLVGHYSGSPDLELNADGTYTLGGKSGSYKVLQNSDGQVQLQFNQSGGGSIVESYDFDGNELYSEKYSQGWIK